jgi:hypothetical protein
MAKNPTTLKMAAHAAVISWGIERQAAIEELRRYLHSQPINLLINELEPINDVNELRMIVAAGAPGDLYSLVLAKLYNLTKGRTK